MLLVSMVTDDIITRVDRLLQCYIGTHNFHNFTSGKKFEEASSKRYIISFEVCVRTYVCMHASCVHSCMCVRMVTLSSSVARSTWPDVVEVAKKEKRSSSYLSKCVDRVS